MPHRQRAGRRRCWGLCATMSRTAPCSWPRAALVCRRLPRCRCSATATGSQRATIRPCCTRPAKAAAPASLAIFRETPLHVFRALRGAVPIRQRRDAAAGPERAGEARRQTGFVVSAAIIVPQIVVVACSPWVGRLAQRLGRRPVLLVGFAALAVARAAVRRPAGRGAAGGDPGAGRRQCHGVRPDHAVDCRRCHAAAAAISISPSARSAWPAAWAPPLSTTAAGWIADTFGAPAAFFGLRSVGLAALLVIWLAMPETRPDRPCRQPAAAQPSASCGRRVWRLMAATEGETRCPRRRT